MHPFLFFCIAERLEQKLTGGTHSGVARAFPGGRVAHPKDPNEDKN